MRRYSLTHEFVESMPSELEEGKLYVSIRYRTASHLCACGCGNKVVTPIRPPKWHVTFDGDAVSLRPSVGNWQLPCRSHYWIEHDRVRWATAWTDNQIAVGREQDARDIRDYYAERRDGPAPKPAAAGDRNPSFVSRLWSRWRNKMASR
jgi:hypothetical protein